MAIYLNGGTKQSCGVAVRLMLHQCRVSTNCLKVILHCVFCHTNPTATQQQPPRQTMNFHIGKKITLH